MKFASRHFNQQEWQAEKMRFAGSHFLNRGGAEERKANLSIWPEVHNLNDIYEQGQSRAKFLSKLRAFEAQLIPNSVACLSHPSFLSRWLLAHQVTEVNCSSDRIQLVLPHPTLDYWKLYSSSSSQTATSWVPKVFVIIIYFRSKSQIVLHPCVHHMLPHLQRPHPLSPPLPASVCTIWSLASACPALKPDRILLPLLTPLTFFYPRVFCHTIPFSWDAFLLHLFLLLLSIPQGHLDPILSLSRDVLDNPWTNLLT